MMHIVLTLHKHRLIQKQQHKLYKKQQHKLDLSPFDIKHTKKEKDCSKSDAGVGCVVVIMELNCRNGFAGLRINGRRAKNNKSVL